MVPRQVSMFEFTDDASIFFAGGRLWFLDLISFFWVQVPAVIQTVDVALKSYFLSPTSEPQLTNPNEVHAAIRCLKVSKAPGPNGIPNRALKRLPKRAVSLLARIFNAVLRNHHIPKRGSTLG